MLFVDPFIYTQNLDCWAPPWTKHQTRSRNPGSQTTYKNMLLHSLVGWCLVVANKSPADDTFFPVEKNKHGGQWETEVDMLVVAQYGEMGIQQEQTVDSDYDIPKDEAASFFISLTGADASFISRTPPWDIQNQNPLWREATSLKKIKPEWYESLLFPHLSCSFSASAALYVALFWLIEYSSFSFNLLSFNIDRKRTTFWVSTEGLQSIRGKIVLIFLNWLFQWVFLK